MTDSEGESSSSSSSHHDLMSVSEPENDSRDEDDMPSVEQIVNEREGPPEDVGSTASNSLSSDEQAAEAEISSHDDAVVSSRPPLVTTSILTETQQPTMDLDDAVAVSIPSGFMLKNSNLLLLLLIF